MQNPDAANPANAGLARGQKADYPADKKQEFEGTPGGYSWISAKDTSLLDYEGCEFVLIASRGDISGAAASADDSGSRGLLARGPAVHASLRDVILVL